MDLNRLASEYSRYVEERTATIFSFEDWVAQTHPEFDLSKIKWKTLKL